MSDFSRWSYTSDITFWPVTTDQFSQPVVGSPTTVKGSWIVGGPAKRDADGIEFAPMGTFWFESADADAPKRQWYIAKGAHTGAPPSSAELIRRVESYDNSTFGDASPPDWAVYT